VTNQTRAPLRIEIAIPESLEALLYTFFDRGIPALVRIAEALERLPAGRTISGTDNVDVEPLRQPVEAQEVSGVHIKITPVPGPAPARHPQADEAPPAPSPNASRVWTDKRIELLRERFRVGGDHLALLAILNAQPGREIVAVEAMLIKAKDLGLGDDLDGWAARNRPAVKPAEVEKQPYQQIVKFSPERTAHLKANWRAANSKEKKEALLAEINAMPGVPIANTDAMMAKVYAERWHKETPPAPPAPMAPAAPDPVPFTPPAAAPARKPPMSPEELARIEARKAKLKEMFERGEDAKQIMIALNRMPGPVLTERDVITRAAAFGFKRPAPLPPEAFVKGGPLTMADIKAWFTEAGGNPNVIPTEARLLTAANALRAAMKLPPFEVMA
jgi:hypothetical protein